MVAVNFSVDLSNGWNGHQQSSERCYSLYQDTYSYFTQVNPIIQRVPGTLLVVGPPGLLEDLINALAFLTFEPVTAGDTWSTRDAIGSRVTVSARGACRPLNATAILGKKRKRCWQWTEETPQHLFQSPLLSNFLFRMVFILLEG